MIASLLVHGVRAIDDRAYTLDPDGVTTIAGPSAWGKSSVMDAVCFVLWGCDRYGKPFPLTTFHGDAKIVDVTMITAKGSTLRRTMKQNRTQTRTMQTKGAAERTFSTEKEWTAALGKTLGEHADACRYAMVPDEWVGLAHSALGGKALRDLLAGFVPGVGLRAVVAEQMATAGHELRDADPIEQKAVEDRRAEAKRRADQRLGAYESDARTVETLTATPAPMGVLDAAELSRLHADVEAHRAWQSYDVAHARAAEEIRTRESAQARRAEWGVRRAALGDRPSLADTGTGTALATAAATLAVAEAAHRTAQGRVATTAAQVMAAAVAPDDKLADAARKLDTYRKALADAERAGDACPHCHRGGWSDAAKAIESARATAKSAEAFHEALTANASMRLDSRTQPLRTLAAEAVRALEEAAGKLDTAKTQHASAVIAHQATAGTRDAVKAWDQSLAALGAEPVVSAPSGTATPPTVSRPEPEVVMLAESKLAGHATASGAARERERALTAAKTKLDAARQASDVAQVEAARMEALVAACRAAPSVLAQTQLDAIGDVSPVELVLTETGGVEVTVDGRGWGDASTGRQIIADAAFRQGLRRLLQPEKQTLPLFVDEVQSVQPREDLVVTGPCVLLITTPEVA